MNKIPADKAKACVTVTGTDGTIYLPTREMYEEYCKEAEAFRNRWVEKTKEFVEYPKPLFGRR